MICYLNGFDDAKEKLIEAKPLLKPYPQIYLSFKEAADFEKDEACSKLKRRNENAADN
jgi:hypothetical protein